MRQRYYTARRRPAYLRPRRRRKIRFPFRFWVLMAITALVVYFAWIYPMGLKRAPAPILIRTER
jgi:hypothetical protein